MTERKKLLLRLAPEVYEAVARWAADDLRSVNAQVEYALRQALRSAGRTPRSADDQQPADDQQQAADQRPADPDGADT